MDLTRLSLDALHSERDLAVYELSGYSDGDTAHPSYQRLQAWLDRIDAELVRRGGR